MLRHTIVDYSFAKFFSTHPTYISPAIVLVVAVVNVDVAAAPATVATAAAIAADDDDGDVPMLQMGFLVFGLL